MLTLIFVFTLFFLSTYLFQDREPSPLPYSLSALPVSLQYAWDSNIQYIYSAFAGLSSISLSTDDIKMFFRSIFTSAMILFSGSSVVHGANSPGCGKDLPRVQEPGGSYSTNITTKDGRERSYIIHIPSNYDKNEPVPVIFSFHGRTRTAKSQEKLSQFSNEEYNPNAIAVYPQGIKNQWQGDPSSQGIDDISFTLQMLDHFEDRYCIDRTRVYAAGKSNGGGLTNRLACDPTASKRFAAFAPVAGAYYQNVTEDNCRPNTVKIQCNPARTPIPMLAFHGTADETIPYTGGGRRGRCLPSVPHFVREWASRDDLGGKNETTTTNGGKVEVSRFGDHGEVVHYRIEGLGHAWPSTEPNSDNPDGTYVDATPIIMGFFDQWTL